MTIEKNMSVDASIGEGDKQKVGDILDKKNAIKGITALESGVLSDSISAGQIFKSEKKTGQTMKNFIEKNGDNNFTVNFGKNLSAELNIGLADLLPEEVTKVRVTGERNEKKYDMTGVRQGLKGGFYNEQGRYIPVFNGFKVEILGSYKKEEIATKKQENEQKTQEILKLPQAKKFEKKYGNEQLETIVRKSQEYGIDPAFLLALRTIENGRDGLDFGIKRGGIDTFEGQLVMSCRTIQNNINRFKRLTGQDAMGGDGILKSEFIGFFSNIYAPIGANNDPNNLNKNHFVNLLTFYSKFSGKNFGNIETIIAQNIDFHKKWNTKINSGEIIGNTTPDNLISNAEKHIGKKYVWGGGRKTDSVTDCSGLILMSMKDAGVVDYGYDSTAAGLSRITKQKSPKDVKRGDFVFLKNSIGHITHVEIARGQVENGKIPIIDASKKRGEVDYRNQIVSNKVLVGTPIFYQA